jgi:hypothetical protein
MRVFRSVPRRLRVVSILLVPVGLIAASPAAARAGVTGTAVAPVITSAGFVQVELREPVDFTVTGTAGPPPVEPASLIRQVPVAGCISATGARPLMRRTASRRVSVPKGGGPSGLPAPHIQVGPSPR